MITLWNSASGLPASGAIPQGIYKIFNCSAQNVKSKIQNRSDQAARAWAHGRRARRRSRSKISNL